MYTRGHRDIYHMQYSRRLNDSAPEACQEIMSIPGLVIIEDIHLRLTDAEYVCSQMSSRPRDDTNRVLFVTRASWRNACRPGDCPSLDALPHIRLSPSPQFAEHIARAYLTRNGTDKAILSTTLHQITHAAGENLWLLAYVCKGATNAADVGRPLDWIRTEVRGELAKLACSKSDGASVRYPQILVAVSMLHQFEVLMQRDFLIDVLGFSEGELVDLENTGELVRAVGSNGVQFYQLNHPEIARAYWTHGHDTYRPRALEAWPDSLTQYIRAGMRNSTQVLRVADERGIQLPLQDLCSDNTFIRIVCGEQDPSTVIWLLGLLPDVCLADQRLLDTVVTQVTLFFAAKDIATLLLLYNQRSEHLCSTLYRRLTDVIDDRMSSSRHMDDICRALVGVQGESVPLAWMLSRFLPADALTTYLRSPPTDIDMLFIEDLIRAVHPYVLRKSLPGLRDYIASFISAAPLKYASITVITLVNVVNRYEGRTYFRDLEAAFYDYVSSGRWSALKVVEILEGLVGMMPRLLDDRRLHDADCIRRLLSACDDVTALRSLLSLAERFGSGNARNLFRTLNCRALARTCNSGGEPVSHEVVIILQYLKQLVPHKLEEVLKAIDWHSFREWLSSRDDLMFSFCTVNNLASVSMTLAREVCDRFDRDLLAEAFVRAWTWRGPIAISPFPSRRRHPSEAVEWLETLATVNRQTGIDLVASVTPRRIARYFGQSSHAGLWSFLRALRRLSPHDADELCSLVDIDAVSRQTCEGNDLEDLCGLAEYCEAINDYSHLSRMRQGLFMKLLRKEGRWSENWVRVLRIIDLLAKTPALKSVVVPLRARDIAEAVTTRRMNRYQISAILTSLRRINPALTQEGFRMVLLAAESSESNIYPWMDFAAK